MQMMRWPLIVLLAGVFGCSGLPAQASKPSVPMEVVVVLQEEADGTWRVMTMATTQAAFADGELTVKGPAGARLLRGEDRWQGALVAGESAGIVGWYELKEGAAKGQGAWRAKLHATIGGMSMTRLGVAHLPGAVQKPHTAPIKAGAEEYPSK